MESRETSPLISPSIQSDGHKTVPTAHSTIYVIILSIIAGLGGLLFGYDTGIVSGALLFISDDFHLTGPDSPIVKDVIVSGAVAGAILGALIGQWTNRWGRKPTIMISSTVFVVGSLFMAFSPTVALLICGRVIVGIGVGISAMTIPMYLAECAPASKRGAIVSINVLMITTGQFVASFVAVAFSKETNGWRWMLGIGALPAVLQFVGMVFLTESPRWLSANDMEDKCRRVLCRLRNSDDVDAEMREMGHSHEQRAITCSPPRQLRRALIVGLGMQFLQQITGINTVMYYGATIIKIATCVDNVEAVWWNLAVAFTNAAFTVIGLLLIDRMGRRILVLVSLTGVFLSLLGLATSFIVPISPYFSILFLILYLVFFAPGMGPVPWTLNSEIYAYEYRTAANSMASMVNWGTNLIVSLTFLVLMDVLQPYGTFYLYSAIAVCAWVFVWIKVPETKGMSLEEIGRTI